MFKSVEDKDSDQWEVLDLDTKKYIRGVQWADDKTGKYHKFVFNKKSEVIRQYCTITQQFETVQETKKGNIKLVRK